MVISALRPFHIDVIDNWAVPTLCVWASRLTSAHTHSLPASLARGSITAVSATAGSEAQLVCAVGVVLRTECACAHHAVNFFFLKISGFHLHNTTFNVFVLVWLTHTYIIYFNPLISLILYHYLCTFSMSLITIYRPIQRLFLRYSSMMLP